MNIIHDTERPHATLGAADGDDGFFLHGLEPSGPPGARGDGGDMAAAKARLNDYDTNSVSTDEVDTGIHVRTEDIQSLDEDSSLRDSSDIDPDCEATTRSCPLPDRAESQRSRESGPKGVGDTNPEGERGDGGDRSSPCPGSAPTLPRSHTVSPISSSGGSGGGVVRMTSFAEQKYKKLEGRSSGGTTPESSDLNVPHTHPNFSSQVLSLSFILSPKCSARTEMYLMNFQLLDLFTSFANNVSESSDAYAERPLPPHRLRDDSAEDEAGGETPSH